MLLSYGWHPSLKSCSCRAYLETRIASWTYIGSVTMRLRKRLRFLGSTLDIHTTRGGFMSRITEMWMQNQLIWELQMFLVWNTLHCFLQLQLLRQLDHVSLKRNCFKSMHRVCIYELILELYHTTGFFFIISQKKKYYPEIFKIWRKRYEKRQVLK